MSMTPEETTDRLTFLTTGPILCTWHGCRQRLEIISCDDTKLLMQFLHCSLEEVDRKLWEFTQKNLGTLDRLGRIAYSVAHDTDV